ncbi:Tubulin-tyrsoine ligase-like protein [Lasiodiplodia theobromae]|uniref:Uncharacterized protein n=1 Tax=Lasiodiplodia theobromae TaxID=45133 RepID=A0A5N5DHR6_9PEZI|nr:Tubulin-tyrsoine ligase-like protein [Lasiodiplodia theobromae]KAB2577267.1 hypothetical protein DBV05_g4126 [Lasiodiplodia theobromae]KAF4538723.1 Tubulin-tyrsoine ligase-like protein [Lasiodiplodia theobromae]
MATAAPPDTKPAQPAAPTTTQKPDDKPVRHPHNAGALLESMQAMLNGALLEIGHSMKNPQRPKLTFPSTQGLNGPRHNNISISASYERFHQCLDEIEHELFRAKAVLRRDLAVKREEREKREKAEQERALEAAQKIAAEKKAAAPPPVVPVKQEKQQKDVDMTDAPAAAPASSKSTAGAPSVAAHTHLPPRPPAIQTQASTGDSAQPAPATATTDDLFGRTPTTAGVNNNADFDSMFEDFAASNDNENNGGDTAMGGDGNDEFDFALLPGLESYANSDSNDGPGGSSTNKDAAIEIDFSALDNTAEKNKAAEEEQKKKREEEEKKKKEEEEKKKKEEEEQKKQDEAQQNQQQQDSQDLNDMFGQGDSTFDDLFNYTDFDMGGAGGSTGGGDTTFDDDFFNI